MSRHIDGTSPTHLSQSFRWDTNMAAYNALRCKKCLAKWHHEGECLSCAGTGIDAIPMAEVMSIR